jgi:hypothetical protein
MIEVDIIQVFEAEGIELRRAGKGEHVCSKS